MASDTAPAQWDGRPCNPEVDGWYWLINDAGRCAMWWLAAAGGWCGSDCAQLACDMPPDEATDYYNASEPMITPSEHHQRTQAAAAAAWLAAREAGAAHIEANARPIDSTSSFISQGRNAGAHEAAMLLRALPLPADAMAALAEVVKRAKEEEREACAALLEAGGNHDGRTIVQGVWVPRRAAMLCAAAIRARGEGGE